MVRSMWLEALSHLVYSCQLTIPGQGQTDSLLPKFARRWESDKMAAMVERPSFDVGASVAHRNEKSRLPVATDNGFEGCLFAGGTLQQQTDPTSVVSARERDPSRTELGKNPNSEFG
jgi:hypothetical protein